MADDASDTPALLARLLVLVSERLNAEGVTLEEVGTRLVALAGQRASPGFCREWTALDEALGRVAWCNPQSVAVRAARALLYLLPADVSSMALRRSRQIIAPRPGDSPLVASIETLITRLGERIKASGASPSGTAPGPRPPATPPTKPSREPRRG